MNISEVSKKGNYVTIKISNGESLTIHHEIFMKYQLFLDSEVDKSSITNAKMEEELRRVKNLALWYLGRRAHSRKELWDKLNKKEFNKERISSALDYLEEYGYVDDKKFAEQYFDSRVRYRKKGINKIKAELLKKGVSTEIIADLISEKIHDDVHIENARYFAEKIKQLSSKSLNGFQLKQKVYSHLMYKGFTIDVINQVINKIKFQ